VELQLHRSGGTSPPLPELFRESPPPSPPFGFVGESLAKRRAKGERRAHQAAARCSGWLARPPSPSPKLPSREACCESEPPISTTTCRASAAPASDRSSSSCSAALPPHHGGHLACGATVLPRSRRHRRPSRCRVRVRVRVRVGVWGGGGGEGEGEG
jgi:hypothetical protein